MVDGFLGDAGTFTLDLSCALPEPEPEFDATVECGTSTAEDTTSSSDDISSYSCSSWNATGPELVFAFSPTSWSRLETGWRNRWRSSSCTTGRVSIGR